MMIVMVATVAVVGVAIVVEEVMVVEIHFQRKPLNKHSILHLVSVLVKQLKKYSIKLLKRALRELWRYQQLRC